MPHGIHCSIKVLYSSRASSRLSRCRVSFAWKSTLAAGHVAALRYLRAHTGLLTVNLGTGRPVSVLEMVRSFEKASGRPVPYRLVARRPGDVAQCWADPSLAQRLLGWTAQLDVGRMCADAWRWQNGVARTLS